MPQMVYINEIRRDTFLHFSTDGESYCLRDFSPSGTGPAVEIERQSEGRTASTIRELSRKPGNHLIEVSGQGMGVGKYAFLARSNAEVERTFNPRQSRRHRKKD